MPCSLFEYLSNKHGKELQSSPSRNIYLRQMQICRVNHGLRLDLLIKLYVCHYIQAQNALLQCIILCVYHHTYHTQIQLRYIKGEVAFSGKLKPNFKKSGLFQHHRVEHTLTSWWINKLCLSLYKGNKVRKKQETAYLSSSFSICDIFSISWDEKFCVSKVSFGSK